jgi:putative transposase
MSLLHGRFLTKRSGQMDCLKKLRWIRAAPIKLGVNTINLALAMLCMFGGLPLQMTVRQIKYLNNIIEQDHRFVKKITNGMRGFKAFHSAEATLSGIELHHMLRKNQHTQSNELTIFEQFYGLAA